VTAPDGLKLVAASLLRYHGNVSIETVDNGYRKIVTFYDPVEDGTQRSYVEVSDDATDAYMARSP
jgi:hypothetical protein